MTELKVGSNVRDMTRPGIVGVLNKYFVFKGRLHALVKVAPGQAGWRKIAAENVRLVRHADGPSEPAPRRRVRTYDGDLVKRQRLAREARLAEIEVEVGVDDEVDWDPGDAQQLWARAAAVRRASLTATGGRYEGE
jgi:hypothetical protein